VGIAASGRGRVHASADQAEPFRRAGVLANDMAVYDIVESSTDFTPGDRDEARREAGIHGDPALLWVGHLNPNKDPLTILRAIRRALPRVPDLQLWCAFGSGELLPVMQDLLREDQEARLARAPARRLSAGRIETLCRACDVFVLGSNSKAAATR
jgi:glycosyltransferase involved in cell wall biosynthesis